MGCENAQRGAEITGRASFPKNGLWRTGTLQEEPHVLNSLHVVARLACLTVPLLVWLKMTFLNAEDMIPDSQIHGLRVHTLDFTGFKEQGYCQVTLVF